jgi:hypothetical protein
MACNGLPSQFACIPCSVALAVFCKAAAAISLLHLAVCSQPQQLLLLLLLHCPCGLATTLSCLLLLLLIICLHLSAGTPGDELEHLEAVVGRASQLHIAEKKPVQVPDPGQVRGCT